MRRRPSDEALARFRAVITVSFAVKIAALLALLEWLHLAGVIS